MPYRIEQQVRLDDAMIAVDRQEYARLLRAAEVLRILEDSSELFEKPRRWYVRLHRRSLLLRRFPGETLGFHHPTIEIYRLYCPSGTD